MIQYITKQISSEFIGERGIRLELVARASGGAWLNIVLRKQMDTSTEGFKIQKKNGDNMYKRSLYYLSKLYSS